MSFTIRLLIQARNFKVEMFKTLILLSLFALPPGQAQVLDVLEQSGEMSVSELGVGSLSIVGFLDICNRYQFTSKDIQTVSQANLKARFKKVNHGLILPLAAKEKGEMRSALDDNQRRFLWRFSVASQSFGDLKDAGSIALPVDQLGYCSLTNSSIRIDLPGLITNHLVNIYLDVPEKIGSDGLRVRARKMEMFQESRNLSFIGKHALKGGDDSIHFVGYCNSMVYFWFDSSSDVKFLSDLSRKQRKFDARAILKEFKTSYGKEFRDFLDRP